MFILEVYMKRMLSALIALLLLALPLVALTGCAKSTVLLKIDPTAEEKRVVGKVGEFDIYYDELRYITMTYKDQLEDKYGEGIWKNADTAAPYMDELEKKVYDSITANYGVLTLAKQNGISVDDREIAEYCNIQLEEMAASISLMLISSYTPKNDGSETADTSSEQEDAGETEKIQYEEYTPTNEDINEAYKKQLEHAYLTDRYVRFTFAVDGCVERLVIKYIEDGKLYSEEADIMKYIKSNFCRTLHVFVRNDDGENLEDNRAEAQKVLDELKAGKSFNNMVGSKYNDDLLTTSVNGHYFGKGEMNEAYEKAAYELDVNEYSGIVETDEGFYIIKRLPIEDDYVNTYFEELKMQYQYAAVNTDISEIRDELSFEANELGRSIALWSIK